MLKKNLLRIPVMLGYTTLLLGLITVFDLSSAQKPTGPQYELKGKCIKKLCNKFIFENYALLKLTSATDHKTLVCTEKKITTRKLHLQANVTKKVIILHNPSYRL